MKNIEIKKLDEELLYSKVSRLHTFDVNGKTIRVYYYSKEDMELSDYEHEIEINEDDKELLSDEEYEIFDNDLPDWIDLDVGKKLKVKGWEE